MAESTKKPVSGETGDEVLVPPRCADFRRPVVSILGLPFDAVTLADAVVRVREAAFSKRRCVVSTPNVNFVVAAHIDPEFRSSVLRSDLNLVDGMPLVWIARLQGVSVPMRVAGSDLFEALIEHPGPAMSVYFFGGPPGAAAAACQRVNRRAGGMHCVGFESPGVETVEALSSAQRIDRINRSGAQFVVIALGAKKGQAWIERNASRLAAPVMSHLGAVVNFAAGSLRRAPEWMRRSGLEWLWRIKEEPQLWKRYWSDGLMLASVVATRVVPELLFAQGGRRAAATKVTVTSVRNSGETILRLRGGWRDSNDLDELAHAFEVAAADQTCVVVELTDVTEAGNRFAALMLVADGWFGSRGGFRVVGAGQEVVASLRRMGVSLAH